MLGVVVFLILLVIVGVFVYTQYFIPRIYKLRLEKSTPFGTNGVISINNINKELDDGSQLVA